MIKYQIKGNAATRKNCSKINFAIINNGSAQNKRIAVNKSQFTASCAHTIIKKEDNRLERKKEVVNELHNWCNIVHK